MTRDALMPYRSKRDFKRTPEPKGKIGRKKGALYIIQKHAAMRLHYDFRLELDGTLKSWAVTRGPSLDPADKRLAVHVEDHPLDYGGFEGTIPKGDYGGGTVMLWDKGSWEPLGDARAMYKAGRLKFRLRGKKLKGIWNLVRMRPRAGEKRENWLLIKSHDEEAKPGAGDRMLAREDRSVKSGRSMEEITKGSRKTRRSKRGNGIQKAREKRSGKTIKAKKPEKDERGSKAQMPRFIAPQLATRVERVPEGDAWVHELKLDGYRAICRIERGKVKILTRNALDWTGRFQSIARALARLKTTSAMMDGEIIVLDDKGVPDFGLLQQAISEGRAAKMALVAFDLLYLDGYDLRALPLLARKEKLRRLIGKGNAQIRYSAHSTVGGEAALRAACKEGFEGLVSKRADDPYHSGRGTSWLKEKCGERQEFVIGGVMPSRVDARAVGSLLLGTYEGGRLRYAGRTGTGFDAKEARELFVRLSKLKRKTSPFEGGEASARGGAIFVEPRLVCEVRFEEWTRDRLVRQAAFIALREDKSAKAISRERPKDTAHG